MKANILIVYFVFLILVVPDFSMADEVQPDYREFTDNHLRMETWRNNYSDRQPDHFQN